ncbi:exonuclease domain-containing protein [Gudongella oleilytica]|uniref:exonuclease domain-containing protein n=1 Tax=Gudongella oleilytica TaxID=1582259 RepID=UPI002A369873|nr:exonuclease domain-containing protein [Gudongella oleilytica]MDY0256020.1 exonuclease domain-containing protein [Gudongella oleilytica]
MFQDFKVTRNKGNSLTHIPTDYVIIDIETTGLDPEFDSIIEIGALKINNQEIVDEFQSLVKPPFEESSITGVNRCYVDDFIVNLTGITNEMLENAPELNDILPKFIEFIEDYPLVGHNVHFDINFLYDSTEYILNHTLNNDFMDFLRISRKIYPGLPNHKLSTIADHLGHNESSLHRSLADCNLTYKCVKSTINYAIENQINFDRLFLQNKHNKTDLRQIKSELNNIDQDHMFYDRYVTFTGTLEKMQRADAAHLVANLGGKCLNGVTKQTNFLILGNMDYSSNIKNGKSSKLKKAEELILKGQDLKVISENVFYDLLDY